MLILSSTEWDSRDEYWGFTDISSDLIAPKIGECCAYKGWMDTFCSSVKWKKYFPYIFCQV